MENSAIPECKKTTITENLVSHDEAPSNNNTSIKQECAGFLTCRTSLIEKCRLIARTGDGVKKHTQMTEIWAVRSAARKFASLAQLVVLLRHFSVLFKQTLRLIKSPALNVSAEGKEIFRAENTFADNSWPRYFPKDGCAHSSAHCVCVCWLRCGQIYFQVIFSPRSSFFSVLWGFCCFCACVPVRACVCYKLTNRNLRSCWQLKHSRHQGCRTWRCTGILLHRAGVSSCSAQELFPCRRWNVWRWGSCHHVQWFLYIKNCSFFSFSLFFFVSDAKLKRVKNVLSFAPGSNVLCFTNIPLPPQTRTLLCCRTPAPR